MVTKQKATLPTPALIDRSLAEAIVSAVWPDVSFEVIGDRLDKGILLWEQDTVREVGGGLPDLYTVGCDPSRKPKPGEASEYTVQASADARECDCADFVWRTGRSGFSVCKHLVAAVLFAGLGRPWTPGPITEEADVELTVSPAGMTDEEYEAWSESLYNEPPDDEEDWRAAGLTDEPNTADWLTMTGHLR